MTAHVVIVGHDLEDEPGYGLILELRSERDDVPIIAIASRDQDAARLVRTGAHAVCTISGTIATTR